MIKYYSINGELLLKEQAVLNVSDLAIQRGYGLFDYFLVKQSCPLFFDDYLDRVEQSLNTLHLRMPVSREELKRQVLQLVQANDTQEAGIKIVLTGGYSPDGYSPTMPNLVIIESPLPQYAPAKFNDGVKLMGYEYHRTFPSAKTINYIVGIHLLPQQLAAGAEDVLFHANGLVYETTRANFFLVTEAGVLVTADQGILYGVTRMKTLEIARQHYPVQERDLKLEELRTATEAFITSSTRPIMPVVQVDDITIGSGRPGPVTQRLMVLFREKEEMYLQGTKR